MSFELFLMYFRKIIITITRHFISKAKTQKAHELELIIMINGVIGLLKKSFCRISCHDNRHLKLFFSPRRFKNFSQNLYFIFKNKASYYEAYYPLIESSQKYYGTSV